MRTIKNINQASEFLFLLVGSAYLFAFLSWKNNFYPFETEIFLRLTDLPLLFFGILFAFTSFRLSFSENTPYKKYTKNTLRIPDILTILFALLCIGIIAYIDLFVPNITSLPLG